MICVVNPNDLPDTPVKWEFESAKHAGTGVIFILVNARSRSRPRLHKHPYNEVSIVQAGTPHTFINTGSVLLRQVELHLNARFETAWLEP